MNKTNITDTDIAIVMYIVPHIALTTRQDCLATKMGVALGHLHVAKCELNHAELSSCNHDSLTSPSSRPGRIIVHPGAEHTMHCVTNYSAQMYSVYSLAWPDHLFLLTADQNLTLGIHACMGRGFNYSISECKRQLVVCHAR